MLMQFHGGPCDVGMRTICAERQFDDEIAESVVVNRTAARIECGRGQRSAGPERVGGFTERRCRSNCDAVNGFVIVVGRISELGSQFRRVSELGSRVLGFSGVWRYVRVLRFWGRASGGRRSKRSNSFGMDSVKMGRGEEMQWEAENGEKEDHIGRVDDFLGGNTEDGPVSAYRDEKMQLRDLLDISQVLSEAGSAIIDDSFTRCFKSNAPEPWNWNIYLFPLWVIGVIIRYFILFPLRVILLAGGWIIFLGLFFPLHVALKNHDNIRRQVERGLVEFICSVFVCSWTGIIKYHGPRPSPRPKQVFVANHTSMIDFIILEQMTAFAVIMQKHPGWVGFLQTTVLESLGCIWFNRTEAKDRQIVAQKLKKHIEDPDSNPLLIFPEGTCVNNEYTVIFKKGAFELDCMVCPIAIKYNKIFVDAFWNSKKQSFTMHLMRLMTSWAVVCDVWYLEPQTLRPGETPIEFSERVRTLIAKRAGIKKVPWDGYLKYYRPSPKITDKKQQSFAEAVVRGLEASKHTR